EHLRAEVEFDATISFKGEVSFRTERVYRKCPVRAFCESRQRSHGMHEARMSLRYASLENFACGRIRLELLSLRDAHRLHLSHHGKIALLHRLVVPDAREAVVERGVKDGDGVK